MSSGRHTEDGLATSQSSQAEGKIGPAKALSAHDCCFGALDGEQGSGALVPQGYQTELNSTGPARGMVGDACVLGADRLPPAAARRRPPLPDCAPFSSVAH